MNGPPFRTGITPTMEWIAMCARAGVVAIWSVPPGRALYGLLLEWP